MTKTVKFKRPAAKQTETEANEWVKGGKQETAVINKLPTDPMKRFTIDVPQSLHTRVKIGCASKGVKMADCLREILEKEFPEGENRKIVKS